MKILHMKIVPKITLGAMGALLSTLLAAPTPGQTHAVGPVHNVVLVHGAWADGSSWSDVIACLQATGLHVTAVQNPLTSLEDSVAATRRVLALRQWRGSRFATGRVLGNAENPLGAAR
jgi:hypothetical protein